MNKDEVEMFDEMVSSILDTGLNKKKKQIVESLVFTLLSSEVSDEELGVIADARGVDAVFQAMDKVIVEKFL